MTAPWGMCRWIPKPAGIDGAARLNEILERQLWFGMGVVFFAGIMRGFTGFGAALLAVPIFSILWLPHQAIAAVMCLALLSNIQLLPGALRTAQWRRVLPIGIAALAMIPVGALALVAFDPDLMRRVISGIVLAFALLLISGWRWSGTPGPGGGLAAGALGGLINGAAGTGGPPIILYLLAGKSDAATSRANIIIVYFFMNGGTVASLAANGLVGEDTLWRVLLLAPSWMLGLWAGIHLFRHANETFFRRAALLELVAVGLFGIFYTR